MLRIFFVLITAVHGLIHLMGFTKAFRLASIDQLVQDISRPAGLFWLLSSLLFILSALFFVLKKDWWWMIASAALLLSQVLIVMSWNDAKFGTIANVIVLIAAAIGFGIWSFNRMIVEELNLFAVPHQAQGCVVHEEMLARLPLNVQRWLRRSNIIDKEMIHTAYLKQTGRMRTTPDGRWMSVEAEQWYRTKNPGFLWTADVTAAPGVHLAGRDKYENGNGHMLIKLLSLIPVVDARGKEIDQGTLLRYLGEIVWFPSAALHDYVLWEQLDSSKAKATMTFGGIAASGIYTFDSNGDVVSFAAKRYYDRKGGATLEDWLVTIDPASHKEFGGVRVPTKSTVTWKLADGDFNWFELEIADIRYNVM